MSFWDALSLWAWLQSSWVQSQHLVLSLDERSNEMINVTVIPSNDPPEVVKKRLEEAVRVFFLSVEKEKAHLADQSKSAK